MQALSSSLVSTNVWGYSQVIGHSIADIMVLNPSVTIYTV